MTGGILQLVAQGIENIYINGDPEITTFKTVYRRHSNFSKFETRLDFKTKMNFGHRGLCPIKRHADLLYNLTLVIELSDVDIYYDNKTPSELSTYLASFGVTWTPTDGQTTFSDTDITNIKALINTRLTALTTEQINYDTILLSLLDYAATAYVDDDALSVIDYLTLVIDTLIEDTDDDTEPLYKLFNAYIKDLNLSKKTTTLSNLPGIQSDLRTVIQGIIVLSTKSKGTLTFLDDDGNLIAVYTTAYKTAVVMFDDIHDMIDNFYSNALFQTIITNIVGKLLEMERRMSISFTNLTKSTLVSGIRSQINTELVSFKTAENPTLDSINTSKVKMINIYYYNVIQNLLSIKNIYRSLTKNVDIVYSKLFEYKATNKYDKSAQIIRHDFDMNQYNNLLYNPPTSTYLTNKPTDITITFETLKKNAITKFFSDSDVLYNVREPPYDYMNDYMSDITLWRYILASTSILDNVLSAGDKTALDNILIMDLVPLFTIYDLAERLKDYIDDNVTDAGQATTLKNNINTDIYVPARAAIAPKLFLYLLGGGVNTVIIAYMQNIYTHFVRKTNTDAGVDDNLLFHSFGKTAAPYITYNSTDYNLMAYIEAIFTNEMDTIIDGRTDVTDAKVANIIAQYFLAINDFPDYEEYLADSYVVTIEGVTSTAYSVLSSIYNYYYTNRITYFNNMYTDDLLSPLSYFTPMEETIDYINETVLSNSDIGSFDAYASDITSSLTTIDSHIDDLLSAFTAYTDTFLDSHELMSIENIALSHRTYYFESFDTIWTQLANYINKNFVYDKTIIDLAVVKVNDGIDSDTIADGITLIKTMYQTIINAIDTEAVSPYKGANFTAAWTTYVATNLYDFDLIIPEDLQTTELVMTAAQLIIKFDTELDIITTQTKLYENIGRITTYYDDFATAIGVYEFTRDKLLGDSSDFLKLYSFSGETKQATYDNIYDYYTALNTTSESKTSSLTTYLNSIDTDINKKGRAKFAWIERLGYLMIDEIRLFVDDQVFARTTGQIMDIRNQLMVRNKQSGVEKMIGHTDQLINYDTVYKKKYTIHIPLDLYVSSDRISNSLPLIAMNHSNPSLYVSFKDFNKCAYWDTNVPTRFRKQPSLKSYVMADYIYIEKEERHSFVKSHLEYLIEQIQHNHGTINSADVVDKKVSFKVHFHNVCKEFIWVLRYKDMKSGDRLLPHLYSPLYEPNKEKLANLSIAKKRELDRVKAYLITNISENHIQDIQDTYENSEYGWYFETPSTSTNKNQFYKEIRILLNGNEREEYRDAEYYMYHQSYKYHTRTKSDGIYVYSQSLKPELLQPSGGINAGLFEEIRIEGILEDHVITELTNGKIIEWDCYGVSYNIQRVISGLTGIAFND
jgi:hypothetical protein